MLSFLMPQNLLLLQTYEGFRNFYLPGGKRLYFQKIFDWTKAGHPFNPVQHKFLTFFISEKPKDYKNGIKAILFRKEAGINIETINNKTRFEEVKAFFKTENKIIGQTIKDKTIFSYADSLEELNQFRLISGTSSYIGREGIEFYPQELFLLEIEENMPTNKNTIYLKNYQNQRSKHKIPMQTILLEKKYLNPLIKGVNIEKFHISNDLSFIVPFPYEKEVSTRVPIALADLREKSPLLAKYLINHKKIIEAQTQYNEKIIGKREKEFYALARVGAYSFADNSVVFRDNSKWQAAVVTQMKTNWNELKRPVFQNHAASLSEREDGSFITQDEAHYVCAILNAPISRRLIINSSDSRSFKIRPPLFIPKYSEKNILHKRLSNLSKKAHKNYADGYFIQKVEKEINDVYLKMAGQRNL